MKNSSLTSSSIPAKGMARWGWAMGIIAIGAFSSGPPIIKSVLALGMDPATLMATRYLASMLLLAGTIRVTQPGHFRINRSGLLLCVGAGLLQACATLSFAWSLTRISASVASMIFALHPLVVLGLLALHGEKFTYRHAIRLALGLVGVYLLIGPGGRVDLLGISLVLVACFAFAVYLVMMQWFLHDYTTWTVTLYMIATMSILFTAVWLVRGITWSEPVWLGWAAIGWLAVVVTYLAQMALFVGIRNLGSGQIALLGPVQMLLTVIWSLLFLHERLSLLQSLVGILILVSMLLAVQRLRRSRIEQVTSL